MTMCPKCKVHLVDGVQFCPTCGFHLTRPPGCSRGIWGIVVVAIIALAIYLIIWSKDHHYGHYAEIKDAAEQRVRSDDPDPGGVRFDHRTDNVNPLGDGRYLVGGSYSVNRPDGRREGHYSVLVTLGKDGSLWTAPRY